MATRPALRRMPTVEDEPIEFVWETVKQNAINLRDMVVKGSTRRRSSAQRSPPRPPSSTSTVKVASLQARRAACTHLTMERCYGNDCCINCKRPSRMGWLYKCTQDEESASRLKEPLGTMEVDHLDESSGQQESSVVQLSPWMEKAIQEGHYTSEQVILLRDQRQKVKVTIAAAETHFKDVQALDAFTFPSRSAISSPCVDSNPHLPYPIVTESEGVPITDESSLEENKPRLFPFCLYKCCQTCRPTYRDRAWQTFEHIFEREGPLPIMTFENDQRPLPSASMIRKLGLTEPRRPARNSIGTYSPFRDRDSIINTTSLTSTHRTDDSYDLADAKVEPESRGFRHSMKRAFRGMLIQNRRHRSSSRKHGARASRKTKIREVDAAEFDMALWRQLNDELLSEASNAILPGHDGMDGLEDQEGEVEVGDGVAVTEEAVDFEIADIIMSV